MSYETRYKLKKPLLVYLFALCFMAAPIGNIVASMIALGVYHWYDPESFSRFFSNIPLLDRAWLALTFLAGCALLKQRRWSWMLALIALLLTSVINIHHVFQFSEKLARGKHFFPALFILSDVGILVVLYHFRFPYLDRREAWWGVYPRFRSSIPVTTGSFSGTITNISRTGAFIEPAPGAKLELNKTYTLSFGPLTGVQAEVVHATEAGFGMEFKLDNDQKKLVKKYLRDLDLSPIGDLASAGLIFTN